jgi:hypothetical protein
MRKAAIHHEPPVRLQLQSASIAPLKRYLLSTWYSVYDLVTRPTYSVPLLLNLSGLVTFPLTFVQPNIDGLAEVFGSSFWLAKLN